MRAIVYTSNTGSTAKYAKLLSHQICVPSFSMVEAKTKVKPGAEIIYMGWIMAGKIKGYPEAARKYNIQAVCGVGMGQTGTQLVEILRLKVFSSCKKHLLHKCCIYCSSSHFISSILP